MTHRGLVCPPVGGKSPLDKYWLSIYTITQIHRKKGEDVQIRLNANVEEEQAKRLKHALVDEDISFSEWLRHSIDAYLAEKEPKGNKKSGKRS